MTLYTRKDGMGVGQRPKAWDTLRLR